MTMKTARSGQAAVTKGEFDRVLVHQAFRLPADLFTKFSAGRIMSDYEGVQNETRWESAQGVHRVKLETARFTNDERDHTATPILGSYRYYKADWDWAGELTVGEFWEGDKGYKLVSKHWFGDTEIRLFLRDTREQIAGIEFAIPLTLRQDMKPTRFGQIRGTEQFGLRHRNAGRQSQPPQQRHRHHPGTDAQRRSGLLQPRPPEPGLRGVAPHPPARSVSEVRSGREISHPAPA